MGQCRDWISWLGMGTMRTTIIEDFSRTSEGFKMKIEDGREAGDMPDDGISETQYNTIVKVTESPEKRKTFLIELTTTHYAFSNKASSTARTITEFYQLQSILKENHLYAKVPSLPLKVKLFLSSHSYVSQELARFLFGALSQKQLLSSKALHLFLQTNYSMKVIMLNLAGMRDDSVYTCMVQ